MLLFLLPLGTVVFAWLWPLVWHSAVEGKVECVLACARRECDIGEAVPITLTVVNRAYLPLPFVEVRIHLPDEFSASPGERQPDITFMTHVWMKSRIRASFTVYGFRRGPGVISDVALRGHEGFGLRVYPVSRATAPIRIAVRPNRAAEAEPDYAQALQGLRVVQRFLLPDETVIRGVRPYAYGDPVRHIDWRATAKLGQTMVKQFFPTVQSDILIVLNAQSSEPYWLRHDRAAFEEFCAWITGLVDQLTAMHIGMQFATNAAIAERRLDAAIRHMNSRDLRSLLAHAHPTAAFSLTAILSRLIRAPHAFSDCIVLFSTWESPEQRLMLRQLERAGKQVMVVRGSAHGEEEAEND